LRVPIAMRAFYEQTLWIAQDFLLMHPDLHHRLLGAKSPNNNPGFFSAGG